MVTAVADGSEETNRVQSYRDYLDLWYNLVEAPLVKVGLVLQLSLKFGLESVHYQAL